MKSSLFSEDEGDQFRLETAGKPALEDEASRALGSRCMLSLQLYLPETKASPEAFGQRNNGQRFL